MRSFDLLCQSKCCDGCCKKGSQLKGRCADAGDIAQVKLPNITIKKTHVQIREGAHEMFLRSAIPETLSTTTTAKSRKPTGLCCKRVY